MQWISPFILNSGTPCQIKAIFSWLFEMIGWQMQHYWLLWCLISGHADIAESSCVLWLRDRIENLLFCVLGNCFSKGLQIEMKSYWKVVIFNLFLSPVWQVTFLCISVEVLCMEIWKSYLRMQIFVKNESSFASCFSSILGSHTLC